MEERIKISKEHFGPLKKYLEDERITDIDYNGSQLWVTDIENNRIQVDAKEISQTFIEQFSQRIANQVSRPFNRMNSLLEAETEELRISIVHESVAVSGRSICIRKAPMFIRINPAEAIEKRYCSKELMMFIANCVKTRMNIVFCGEPGAGKTECAKFFSQFIPENDRVITIEDNLEWHYKEINPGKDCVELRVNDEFDYRKAIKSSLRQNPKWIMLSEARSVEVKALLECWSTGIRGFTTIHTDDVRKIPDRILNMLADRIDSDRMENDVYSYVDLGILLRVRKNSKGENYRYIDQICVYTREDGKNYICMMVQDGKFISRELPSNIEKRMKCAGVKNAYFNQDIEKMIIKERPKLYELVS